MDDVEHSVLAALEEHLAALAAEIQMSREVMAPLLRGDTSKGFFVVRGLRSMEAVERGYVAYVLSKCDSNKTQAAQVLEVDPSTLHRKLSRWAEEDLAKEENESNGTSRS